jgi:4-diphosphocytidyl-2-C-methyl-D-erythritol kinase
VKPSVSSERPAASVSIDAPAKINLFLHVTGRRDDGYHLLESFVVFTEAGDRLVVETAETLTLEIEGPFGVGLESSGRDNLVLRAAEALRAAFKINAGARIVLEKNLPVSSGIGGGSADAAAALRALVDFWNLDVTAQRLAEIGIALGADVPVCLHARPAMMSGVGEVVDSVDAPPACGVVLVNAREGVSTPAVFAARSAAFSDAQGWATPDSFDDFVRALSARQNDLFEPARAVSPVIDRVVSALQEDRQCALARLSGSGGTCFGLYRDTVSAEAAAKRINRQHPGWWCASTVFRNSSPPVQSD